MVLATNRSPGRPTRAAEETSAGSEAACSPPAAVGRSASPVVALVVVVVSQPTADRSERRHRKFSSTDTSDGLRSPAVTRPRVWPRDSRAAQALRTRGRCATATTRGPRESSTRANIGWTVTSVLIQLSRSSVHAVQNGASATIGDAIDLTRLPGQVEIGTAWLGMSRVKRQAG